MRAAVRSVLFSAIQGIDLDFVRGRYALNSGYRSDFLGLPGATYTRAGAATAETAAGAIINFAANVPRITDRGVLIEEARTNLLLRSQEFDNAAWTLLGGTVTANATAAPDGTTTADRFVEDTSTGFHHVTVSGMGAAGAHTASVFAKPNGRNWIVVRNEGLDTFFNVSTGAIGTVAAGATATISPAANGFFRCTVTRTMASAAAITFRMATADGVSSYTGDGTSGVFLWGAQLEAGAFPTSYIPTTGAAATRAADVMLVGSLSSFGYPVTLVTRWSRQGGTDAATFYNVASLERASPVNESAIFQRHTTNDIRAFQRTNGTQEADLSCGTGSIGSVQNAAARFASNNVAGSFNGQTVAVDSVVATPTDRPATLCVGSRSTGTTAFLCGYVNSVSVLPYAATDAQLQALTT